MAHEPLRSRRGRARVARAAILAATPLLVAGSMSCIASAQVLTVFGGVTYDPATNSGYRQSFFRYPEGTPLNEYGVAVGWAQIQQGSGGGGERGVRWSSAPGSAIVMGDLGADVTGQTFAYAHSINAAGRSV